MDWAQGLCLAGYIASVLFLEDGPARRRDDMVSSDMRPDKSETGRVEDQ